MIFLRESKERLQITRGNRDTLDNFGSARVSGRAENALGMRGLPEFPRKRMFTAATANH
jgi:hypothetical protein